MAGLCLCAKELREHLALLNSNRRKRPSDGFCKRFISKITREIQTKKGNVFVAIVEEKLAGYIYGVIKDQSAEELEEFKPVKIGEIVDLYVKPKYQNQGIGTQLIDNIIIFFKDECVSIASLLVLNNNLKAVGYYCAFGFQSEASEMSKKL